MNSLHRILLTTLSILTISLFAYLFYKTTSHIGRPLGRILTNLLNKLDDGSDKNKNNTDKPNGAAKHDIETTTTTKHNERVIAERTSSIIGAGLGVFVFMVMFPLAFVGSENPVPAQWLSGGEGQRLVSALFWIGWIAVRCWGETIVVLAVLAGVVKWLGLDGGAAVAGEEKDEKRAS
jgi:hypothetical protein